MTRRHKPLFVRPGHVAAVRAALSETQAEFSKRFFRSRRTIIRWELDGVKFVYQSNRWHLWRSAVGAALKPAITRGLPDEHVKHLRELQILQTQR